MERVWSTSRRGYSARSIFMFVLAVFMTAFLWVVFASSEQTHAIEAPATWKGDSILFNAHQYSSLGEAKTGNSLGITQGTTYYVSLTDDTEADQTPKAMVIYFSPGVDPPTETTATYALYDYDAGTKTYSNKSDIKDINITVKGDENSFSSCTVNGIGWFICPVAVFMADSMDNIFKHVSDFFVVEPVTVNDRSGNLYTAWNMIRGIANIAFIIAFLIIIYSQLTSMGVSNYGLKRLLPRLILAAIFVNISFFICAIAVDISNILGHSLQNIFVQMRQDTFAITDDTWSASTTTWTTVTALVLSGGAIGAAGIATAGTVTGALPALLPILVGVTLTVLFVLLILAARQAIIIILIVIAPLAFVAYLLPNTEKWFEKWRELFMTMLIFFPAFSLVFGGSQLAGGLIIQNASSVIMIIFGLAVQVAPLVITPLLLKLSGGVLGKIAGIINDPRKGALDRAKNWSKDRVEANRQKSLRTMTGNNPFRKIAQRLDNNNRNVKERMAQYSTENDNRYHETEGYGKIHSGQFEANLHKERIENQNQTHAQRAVNATGSDLHIANLELEASKITLGEQTTMTEADIEEYKAGRRVATGKINTLMTSMKESTTATAAHAQRAASAKFEQQKNISGSFSADTVAARALLRTAGGVDPNGMIRAEANARAALLKLEKEALDSSVQLLNVKAIEKGKTLKSYSLTVIQDAIDNNGQKHQAQEIEAALEAAAQDGQVPILRKARMSKNIDQAVLTKLFARNAGTMKEKGAFDLQNDPGLALVSQELMNASIANTIGEVSANNLAGLKAGFWGSIANLDNQNPDTRIRKIIADTNSVGSEADRNGLRKAYANITEALNNDDIRATLGDRLSETIEIHEALHDLYKDSRKTIDYDKYR